MEESTSPRLYDPCDYYGHLYDHFLEQLNEPIIAGPSPTTSDQKVTSKKSPSMLVTGFGMRNLDSLQRALLDDEQRRQLLLSQYDRGEDLEGSSMSSSTTSYLITKTSFTTTPPIRKKSRSKTPSLQYLMGLEEAEEEGTKSLEESPFKEKISMKSAEDEFQMTKAMRQARKYLKDHRIFDFFKFIIAHMLSEMPEDPIEYIMDLLDKCLMYRSGFGNPPLLFEKPHIEQLFHLMDRMKTGYVDVDQYKTGMKTLGICSFDKNPPLNTEGMVSKEFFVEEASDCLTDLLVEMIRSHEVPTTPQSFMTPPPTVVTDLLMDAA